MAYQAEKNIALEPYLAREADLLAVCDVVNSAYCSGQALVSWKNAPGQTGGQRVSLGELESMLSSSTRQLLVIKDDREDGRSEAIGCVLVERNSDGVYFSMLAVSLRYQNQGLGRRLVALAEECALDSFGAEELKAKVLPERTDLTSWYLRLGYEKSSHCVPFNSRDTSQIKTESQFFIEISKPLAKLKNSSQPSGIS